MIVQAQVRRFTDEVVDSRKDDVLEEAPVALVYNGISHVVMMATPVDLKDFAYGFSLSEGIVDDVSGIFAVETAPAACGVEVNIEISQRYMSRLRERRRQMAGSSGCGLCGVEALEQLVTPINKVIPLHLEKSAVQASLAQLPEFQPLRSRTGASHVAAFCSTSGDIRFAFEDVGRHNALDKMLGHWARSPDPGFALVSSRASYEMVYKVCRLGFGALIAVSAPTSMAVDLAHQAGLNLIGFARPGRYQQYLSLC